MAEGKLKRGRYEPVKVTSEDLASIQVIDSQGLDGVWRSRTGPTTPFYPLYPRVADERKPVDEANDEPKPLPNDEWFVGSKLDRKNDASQWEVVGVSSIDGSTFLDVRRCESRQLTFSSLRKFSNGRFEKVASCDDTLKEKDEVVYCDRDSTCFVAEIAKVDRLPDGFSFSVHLKLFNFRVL